MEKVGNAMAYTLGKSEKKCCLEKVNLFEFGNNKVIFIGSHHHHMHTLPRTQIQMNFKCSFHVIAFACFIMARINAFKWKASWLWLWYERTTYPPCRKCHWTECETEKKNTKNRKKAVDANKKFTSHANYVRAAEESAEKEKKERLQLCALAIGLLARFM